MLHKNEIYFIQYKEKAEYIWCSGSNQAFKYFDTSHSQDNLTTSPKSSHPKNLGTNLLCLIGGS